MDARWQGRLTRVAVRICKQGLGSALVVAVLALGCPRGSGATDVETLPPIHTDDVVAEEAMRRADAAANEGRLEEARNGYEAFLREHASDPLAPLAHLGLARLRIDAGDPEGALPDLDVVMAHADPVIAERGRFWRGVAVHLAARPEEALDLLLPLRGRTTDPEETALLLETVAAAAAQTGDHVTALAALDDLARSGPLAAQAEARERIRIMVESELADAELGAAYERLGHDGVAWPLVAVRALAAASAANDAARVREVAATLEGEHIELGSEAAALIERAERMDRADPRVIGAILPLSGEARVIGRHALEGLMLAAGTPAEGPMPDDAPQLVFRDDESDPDRAAEAVEELVTIHRAIAIIGPLGAATSAAAATRAAALGVPLITLTAVDDPLAVGAVVYRLYPSLDGEARELVRASVARGARRIALLLPQNGYGTAMRAAVERVASAEGASLAGTETYDPAATSFGADVTALAGLGADAVLLADASSRVALLAPALAAGGLMSSAPGAPAPRTGRAITVLVSSAGFDTRLGRTAGRYLEGALFAAPFSATLATGAGRTFADAYHERFGTDADVFAAYAYDGFTLARSAVLAGETTRDGVRAWLARASGVATVGASGGFDASRGALHAARIVTLVGGTFTPL